ncbi:DEAD/DEAH box helicase family protein, partial [Herbiconiux daphne]
MSQIIILNGPIGCGKDTVGVAFAEREGWEFTAFKDPMFRIAATTLGMDFHEFIESYQDREWKDSPNEKLNGRTVRELMIHISETYIKPFLGSDYFGQQAADYIRRRPWQRHFIFGDGGFSPEVEALITAGHDVILVHMYRDGCTFEG